jgi:hypothetical protein
MVQITILRLKDSAFSKKLGPTQEITWADFKRLFSSGSGVVYYEFMFFF